jgi:hypothetical protein
MQRELQNVSKKSESIYELKWMWKLLMVANQLVDEYEHVFRLEKLLEYYNNTK